MAVVLRLSRHGAHKRPFYRVVAADKQFPRDGRYLEVVGHYNPLVRDKGAEFKFDRVDYWISKGARPSETVARLLKKARKSGESASAQS